MSNNIWFIGTSTNALNANTANYANTANNANNLGGLPANVYALVNAIVNAIVNAAGSNTQVQYNNSSSFAGSYGFIFDYTQNLVSITNTISIGNSSINTQVNSAYIEINSGTIGIINTGSLGATDNVQTNTIYAITALCVGNSSVNTLVNSAYIEINSGTIGIINTGSLGATANVQTNTIFVTNVNVTTTLYVGNSTVNSIINSSSIHIGNSSFSIGAAAPISGTYIQGSIVWNTGAVAGGFAGWICVNGALGTWKTFGLISS
ncbi:MAG TPA: hypothetical protein VIH90_07410 [Candidatus Saccharimonadales bacterium]